MTFIYVYKKYNTKMLLCKACNFGAYIMDYHPLFELVANIAGVDPFNEFIKFLSFRIHVGFVFVILFP